MATPAQEEVGQELYTRDHGIVKVDKKSWMDGGYHIVLSPNGAYMHSNGLPVKDEKELVKAFGPNKEDLEKAVKWFRTRHEQAENPPRPIGMHPDGYPIFADGTVPDFDDLYAYFKPGKGLTGMIVALQDYKDRQVTGQPSREFKKAAPPKTEIPVEAGPAKAAPSKESKTKTSKKARAAGVTG